MEDTSALILSELRELRSDYNTPARETGERLATVEAQMYSLCGNGQPGRIALLETSVLKLREWRWWVVGVRAGAGGVVSLASWLLMVGHK